MNVTRRQPRYGYVQVLNGVARDYRLSWRARGLLVELLSYPPGYEINIDELVERGREHGKATEGRDAMRKAARELKEIGYIVATKYQDESGRWHTALEVTDDPMYDLLDGVSAGHADDWKPVRRSDLGERAFPQVAPTTGNPTVGFSGVNKKTEKKTETSSSPGPSKARQSQPSRQEEEAKAGPNPKPARGDLAAPVRPPHNGGDGQADDEHQADAAELVSSLPVQSLTRGNRNRLVSLVVAALTAGWTVDQLRAELLRDLGSAASRVGVWVTRLKELGEPPATTTTTAAALPKCDDCNPFRRLEDEYGNDAGPCPCASPLPLTPVGA